MLDHATHAFGLAVPFGIVASTGVAGLTLGGGTGYLTRKHGLTVDNLLEADVVLADGSFVTASATQNPDLFWALRGGGGNFGVVTSFLFKAHPAKMVFAGPIFWDAKDAKQIMAAYRDFLPKAPEELGIFVGLKTVPSMDPFPAEARGKRACAIISCFNGFVKRRYRFVYFRLRLEIEMEGRMSAFSWKSRESKPSSYGCSLSGWDFCSIRKSGCIRYHFFGPGA